jgi:hypothetical protein
VKIGVWYEATLKENPKLKVIVQIRSEEVRKFYPNGDSFLTYEVIARNSSKYSRIVPENWDFRELSALEQELE